MATTRRRGTRSPATGTDSSAGHGQSQHQHNRTKHSRAHRKGRNKSSLERSSTARTLCATVTTVAIVVAVALFALHASRPDNRRQHHLKGKEVTTEKDGSQSEFDVTFTAVDSVDNHAASTADTASTATEDGPFTFIQVREETPLMKAAYDGNYASFVDAYEAEQRQYQDRAQPPQQRREQRGQSSKFASASDDDHADLSSGDGIPPIPVVVVMEETGWSALNYALNGRHDKLHENLDMIVGEHERIIDFLISSGFDEDSACPLYYAIAYVDLAAFTKLMRSLPSSRILECLTMPDHHENTAVHLAAKAWASGFARLFRPSVDPRTSPVHRALGILGPFAPDLLPAPSGAPQFLRGRDIDASVHPLLLKGIRQFVQQDASPQNGTKAELEGHGLVCDDLRDASMQTPLHAAALSGGTTETLAILTDMGCSVDSRDIDGNTPLHVAMSMGYSESYLFLLSRGNNATRLAALDNNLGKTAQQVFDELGFRSLLHSSNDETSSRQDTDSGDGRSGGAALQEPASNTAARACEEVDAASITSVKDFAERFVRGNRPIVVRNYTSRWGARVSGDKEKFNLHLFSAMFDETKVFVNTVPYGDRYGYQAPEEMTLGEFVRNHLADGEKYVFDGSVVPSNPNLVRLFGFPFMVEPQKIILFELLLGGQHTGASPHFHKQVINILYDGQKDWELYPPPSAFFYMVPARDWFGVPRSDGDGAMAAHSSTYKDHIARARRRAGPFISCRQEKGDAVFVPQDWGHAVHNTEPALAVAVEFLP